MPLHSFFYFYKITLLIFFTINNAKRSINITF
jgi:hypothetical protein